MCNGAQTDCISYCDCWGFGDPILPSSPYYGGVACEAKTCYTSDLDIALSQYDPYICSSRGECIDPNVCQCNPGFTGYKCQYNTKDIACFNIPANNSAVCSGRGKCLQPNECSCSKGYEGTNCESFRCYGYLSSDSNVCSGKGKCTDWNVCDCDNGYSGSNCEMVSTIGTSIQRICFGIPSTNSSTCNNRGTCTGLDTCVCNLGYYGSECEKSYCFSIPQNDSSVCNGRGSCNEKDKCDCTSHSSNVLISGSECEIVQCKGYNDQYYYSNEISKVCYGNGVCTPTGCNCSEGYSGDLCQEFSCFGASKSSPNSCSGHGVCSSPDSCSCYSNSTNGFWIGSDCSVCDPSHLGSDCLSSIGACDKYETCNGQGYCAANNTCICDEGFKGEFCNECANDRFGWDCSQVCSRALTCLNHGDCSRDGQFCECDTSQSSGFWKGRNCSSCLDGYFGDFCLTKVSQKFDFNSIGNEIFFDLNGPSNNYGGVVDCSKLLSPSSYSAVGGISARCVYKHSLVQTRLSIELARTSTVKPGNSLDVNMKVFDSQNSPMVLSTLSNSGSNIYAPVAEVLYTNSLVRFTENLVLLGRNRLNVARERPLFYEWSLISSTSSFSALSNLVSSGSGLGNFNLTLLSADLPASNEFAIQLRLKHQDFSLWSHPVIVNFTKEDQPVAQSTAKKYEVYIYPPSDPLYLTEFIFPVSFSYEILEDGVPIDLTTPTAENTMTWSFDPDLQGSGSLTPTITNNQFSLDGTYTDIGDSVVTVKCDVTDNNNNNAVVASSSFKIKFVAVSKPALKTNETDIGTFFSIVSLRGQPVEQSYWECLAPFEHLGKCDPEIEAYFIAGTNLKSIFIPIHLILKHKATYYARVSLVVNGLHYKVQSYSVAKDGLEISKIDSTDVVNFVYLQRTHQTYSLYYQNTHRPMISNPSYSLFDEFGNNITDILQLDSVKKSLELDPSKIPAQSSLLTLSLSDTNTIEYTKTIHAYVDALPKSNCSFSISVEPVSVPIFNGVLYFYNITASCSISSKLPDVDVYLKNQNTDLIGCSRKPLISSSRSCYMLLPELIGTTEVYANVTTNTKIALLPVEYVNELVPIGNLREQQTTPSTEIESLQQMFYQYFSDPGDVKEASSTLQDQIKRLLYIHYPEKELLYPEI